MIVFEDEKLRGRVSALHTSEIENRVRLYATKTGMQYMNLAGITINPDALSLIPQEVAERLGIAAYMLQGTILYVGSRNPHDELVKKEIDRLSGLGYVIRQSVVSDASLKHAFERYKDIKSTRASKAGGFEVDAALVAEIMRDIRSHSDVDHMIHTLGDREHVEQVSRAVSILFAGAQALDSSDIHIEPEEDLIRVRYRIDGVLWEVTILGAEIYKQILSRIKLLAGMRLNVHDEAQDGRLSFALAGKDIDVRVSVIPGGNGESIVMRLLNPDISRFNMDTLGLNNTLLDIVKNELARPNGAIITTGPTGSGKTTALYSFLRYVHKPELKIITIEDPIEYKLPGIVQTQVSKEYTFASGLRAVLRQDPDVIMVGEIRDYEVAETAVHAALTGHLVFSTLHTNSAIGAIPRLIDIGIDPNIIGSAFNLILGQRLVRRLCGACKVERALTSEETKLIVRIMGEPPAQQTVFEAKGCEKCGMSGYKGRIGVYEAVQVTPEFSVHISKTTSEAELLRHAMKQGIPTMQQDGLMKVFAGVTTIDELSRVVDIYHVVTPKKEDTQ